MKWKDVVYDTTHGLRLRVYVPASISDGKKLPVLVYFHHGGGFCLASYELPKFHSGAFRLAAELPARSRAPPPRGARGRRVHPRVAGRTSGRRHRPVARRVCRLRPGVRLRRHRAPRRRAARPGTPRPRPGQARRVRDALAVLCRRGEDTPSEAASCDPDDFLGTISFDQMWRLVGSRPGSVALAAAGGHRLSAGACRGP